MNLPTLGRSGRVAVAVITLALSACVTPRPQSREMAGMLPVLSVERFLQAVNARDFEAMRELFGTHSGPINGERREIEIRMAAIAGILRHEDYKIVEDQREPGREYPTTLVTVSLTKGGRNIPDVPLLVVQTDNGGWLVEQVDMEKITKL
ncbi:MAG: hypothetical protein EXR95_06750 [Gemmatimonadetes bacterium]|nr:hypothetical protein [Gemmatimonadota bacterium]